MRVAIVHDWLDSRGGAEETLKALIEVYPHAEIYSLVDFLNDNDKSYILNNKKVNTSFIQKLPFSKKYFRYYLPLFPIAIEQFDLNKYDLIISSSWAFAKGVLVNAEQLHINYCYTPIRYAWDLYHEYTKELKGIKALIIKYFLHKIRIWDTISANRVDYFIADSEFVAKRVKKVYRRDAVTIYPPVDTNKFQFYEQKEEFYLTASRLVGYKRVDLIVKAFNKNGKELIVIGDGEEFEKIKAIAKDNIKVLGYQNDEVLINYMQKAKGFVFCALEDFGIVPVEAMACGTPVICLNRGGTAESVIDRVTGIHFSNQNENDIIKAIEEFENSITTFDTKKINKHSQKFSKDRFKEEIKGFINNAIKNQK